MGWWGTAFGGAVGLAVGGPLGALVGAAIGRGLDRGAARVDLFGGATASGRARLKERFFETTFEVMGHLTKADGRVSAPEIAFAESVMDRMELSAALRRAAILCFNQGKAPGFDLMGSLSGLSRAGLGQGPLLQIFLEVQLGAAHADGEPTAGQREILERIRRALQMPLASYRRLERLILIQKRVPGGFGANPGAGRSGGSRSQGASRGRALDPLAGAYATLGVEPGASDAEVKQAYRRLMNRHHPDKLASRGMPEEALKLASQKTQEIRRAYEAIARTRAA